jgi:hypothetical protein
LLLGRIAQIIFQFVCINLNQVHDTALLAAHGSQVTSIHAAHLAHHRFLVPHRCLPLFQRLLGFYLPAQLISHFNDFLVRLCGLLLENLLANVLPFRREFTEQVVEKGLTGDFLFARVCVDGALNVRRDLYFPLFFALK